MASYPGDTLKSNVKDLLASGLFSDLVLDCGDKVFKVHKAILYPQSKYFQKLLAGGFKESVEDVSTLALPEEPAVISTMVHFLYHFKWDDSSRGDIPPPIFAIRVYAAADVYDIQRLRVLATARFKETLDTRVPSCLVDAVRAVEEHIWAEDHTFWDHLLPFVKKDMSVLLRNTEFLALLDESMDLKYRLLARLADTIDQKAHESQKEKEDKEDGFVYDLTWGSHYPHGCGRHLGRS